MFYELARPLLFLLDPERAHELALSRLDQARRCGLGALLRPRLADDPIDALGLRFRNPVGLAAGLDKNGEHIDSLGELGFGFIEVGTVTPRAQPGNPKPRLFRLPDQRALINRLGFNNRGVDEFVANVGQCRAYSAAGGVIGLNIGKNADTPLDRALDDYVYCLRKIYPLLAGRPGYVTVNISSPNTRNLRALQSGNELETLLQGLEQERARLVDRHGTRVALAVKIAPDLDQTDLRFIADALVAHGIDAIIATNTTLDRAPVADVPNAAEAGGLSGAPLEELSTQVIRHLSGHLQGRLPIIGVGGILAGADAVRKIEAGASLVQLYTGLVYRGPNLVGECRRAIQVFRRKSATRPLTAVASTG